MPFEVADSTLESLEWDRLVELLRACCRTPQGRASLAEAQSGDRSGGDKAGERPAQGDRSLFEASAAAARTRMKETTEARGLLDHDAMPPLGGCASIEADLSHAEKGGVLEAASLLDIRATLEALHATRHFFERREEDTPALCNLARPLGEYPALESNIARCIDGGGEIKDSASSALAQARRDLGRLAGDLQSRIERSLRNADITPHLSDQFYTVRNGRFVLPVKSDAKGQVRGIVHDASRSGTTLYIEPDGMVELNNKHRQAELTVDREILRILRDLSAEVARESASIRASLEWLASIDLAVARGQLSRQTEGVEPEIGEAGVLELPGLRHPLLPPAECVANDLRVGADYAVLILSGPNAGGKTVALKSVALAALMVRAGLHVPANPGARVDLLDGVLADIGDHQDIQESLSTFSAAMANLAAILRTSGPNTLVCLDEIGVGTDPSEGAAIAQSTLEALAESGARVVTTTHYNLLKEMAEVDARFKNASVEIDPITFAPTYRVRIGAPGSSSATTVAARMGVPESVLERAAALLDREDRRLDQMLSELGATRASLESEKAEAISLRVESERTRDEYAAKLARLNERRDKLFGELRGELEDSFKGAHSEVARIIAELQRSPSSRRAAAAREQLKSLRKETNEKQAESGLTPDPVPTEPEVEPIDWTRAAIGDAVRAPGGGTGTLLSLPDPKGRVRVQVSGAKLTVSKSQLASPGKGDAGGNAQKGGSRAERRRQDASTLPPARIGGLVETDLRGLRVDEAIQKLESDLDVAAAQGRDEIRIIHGIGTGAVKRAVRDLLPHSPLVIDFRDSAREEGGAGATHAVLQKD
ncbi:MAG: endonuclease MutS2 [Myxococcota bacterium]